MQNQSALPTPRQQTYPSCLDGSEPNPHHLRKYQSQTHSESMSAQTSLQELNRPEVLCEDKVREQLKQVIDPELFVNIVDLGLIYVVDLAANAEDAEKTDVRVEMTLTSPMCPAGPQLVANSRQVIEAMEGIGSVDIKVVMDPPWTQDRMTDDARDQLGIF